MLVKLIRMLDPAAVSEIMPGGERRAISAICTPFQLAAEQPARNTKVTTAHNGQVVSLNPSSTVVVADTTAAMDNVAVAEWTRSDIQPSTMRPITPPT